MVALRDISQEVLVARHKSLVAPARRAGNFARDAKFRGRKKQKNVDCSFLPKDNMAFVQMVYSKVTKQAYFVIKSSLISLLLLKRHINLSL